MSWQGSKADRRHVATALRAFAVPTWARPEGATRRDACRTARRGRTPSPPQVHTEDRTHRANVDAVGAVEAMQCPRA